MSRESEKLVDALERWLEVRAKAKSGFWPDVTAEHEAGARAALADEIDQHHTWGPILIPEQPDE